MPELLKRTVELRADEETGVVSGIAVPWDTPTDVGGYIESIARGAADDTMPKFFWQHSDVIGRVVETEDRDEGLFIKAKVSDTTLGRDALTLLRDGALSSFSIGFEPLEHRKADDGTIVRTKIRIHEVSAVTFPAYKSAIVTDVRQESSHREANNKKEAPMPETVTKGDLLEVRTLIEDLDRKVQTLPTTPQAPTVDTRSAGEVLKAIVAGDAETIRSYTALQERAYTGATTTDLGTTLKPGWVGNLTRIFDASSGVLADVFSTGTLPASGMSIEYAELASNTVPFAEQAAEGDDITFGKVVLTTKTAPVKTYAGGAQLTRQEIERSSIGVLNTTLDAMATAAGARKKAVLRTAYNTLVAAREAVTLNGGVVLLGAVLGSATAGNWEDALIDAAIKFEAENLNIDAMIVSGTVFKKLRSLTVAGERVFQTYRDNASGELNLPGLTGSLAGLPVRLDSGQAGDKAVFVNGRAIRQYDSALVSLSNENIVNLSKSFAVYKYGAVAAELPAGVVPVKLAAS